MEALQRANHIRSSRAEIKREMKHGKRSPRLTLAAPPAELDTMKVFDLLVAIPKIGRVKAGKVLKVAQVSPSRTVGGLSDRQRRELLGLLGAWAR
jgi:hypothetical protein